MIDLAAPTGPAAMPGGPGNGASREAAGGFADLVGRPGSGKPAPGAAGGTGDRSGALDDPATSEGAKEAVEPADDGAPAAGERPAGWRVRGLHEILASLLDERGAPAGEDGAPAGATPGASGEAEVVTGEATIQTHDAEDGTAETDVEEPDGSGRDTGDVDPEAAAAMAAAVVPIAQPRDLHPGGAPAGRPAEHAAAAPAAPVAAPQEESGEQDDGPSREGRRGEAAPEAGIRQNAAPETGEIKIRVIADTVAPAPGLSQNGRTVADLAATIASDDGWKGAVERAAASAADAPDAPAGPVRDLRIQLNPAELGSVDARLRIVGEQLSVEIRVEGREAFRRLSSEKDAILTALRGLGFAVDDVSIQQQPVASTQSPAGPGSRQGEPSGGLPQGAGRGHQGEGGTAGGRPRGDEQGGQNGDARTPATRPAGGGIYI
ncbi:flagellar hook-length control protein FliK [Aquibium microcysteis]|uniref:flagellar hook-length control protein FliK n=1 Tax=Aquibium microcysteis TaxID=675281 RepID=UPI00165D0224|nr:flagellar hook-length control protein FliK [Aquibium microcysteis]